MCCHAAPESPGKILCAVPTVRLSLTPRVEWDVAPATVRLNTDTDAKRWIAGHFGLDVLSWLSQKHSPLTIDFRSHAAELSLRRRRIIVDLDPAKPPTTATVRSRQFEKDQRHYRLGKAKREWPNCQFG